MIFNIPLNKCTLGEQAFSFGNLYIFDAEGAWQIFVESMIEKVFTL